MYKQFYLLFLLSLFGNFLKCSAQIIREPDSYGIEYCQTDDSECEFYIEEFDEVKSDPFDLNTITLEELSVFPFLSEFQKKSILYYVENNKPLISVYELQLVLGLPNDVIYMLLPYVCVKPIVEKTSLNSAFSEVHGNVLVKSKLDLQEDNNWFEKDSNSIGPSDYQKIKLNIKASSIVDAGFMVEKDKGEMYSCENEIFDFQSAFISVRNIGVVETAIVGDFHLSLGQGLVSWTGFSMNKGVSSTHIRKSAAQIKPYCSTNENSFYRGGAVLFRREGLSFLLGASSVKQDAKIDTVDEQNVVLSIVSDGYHNTEEKLQQKNNIKKQTLFSSFGYRHTFFNININSVWHRWNNTFVYNDKLYKLNDNRNCDLQNTSVDYTIGKGAVYVWGEHAIDNDIALASVNGIVLQPMDDLEFAVLYRNYSPLYNSEISAGFGEYSGTQNEKGMYYAFEFRLIQNVILSGYIDFFHSPWLRYNVSFPHWGRETLLFAKWMLRDKTELSLRYKYEQKEKNNQVAVLETPVDEVKSSMRIMLYASISDKVALRSVAQTAWYNKVDVKQGSVVAQDVIFSFGNNLLRNYVRVAYFNTQTNAGVYLYESDVAYSFSVLQYAGKGVRTYYVLKWKAYRKMTIECKIAHNIKENSEPDLSYGLTQHTEASLQLRIRF